MKKKPTNLTLDYKLKDKLQKKADKLSTSKSNIVERLIRNFLELVK